MRLVGVMVLVAAAAACSGSPATDAAGAAEAAPATAAAAASSAGAASAAAAAAETAASASAAAAAPAAPAFREVTIPAGTQLHVELQSAVASDSSSVEDAVRGELRQAVRVDGHTVLPAGAEVVGAVTDVERAGRVKGRARVAFRFTSVRVGGERYDIRTASIARQAAASKGDDAKKIGIGAGAGAAIGAILGGGDGAAKGAAIGGASGTGVVLATRGKEIRLGPGADVITTLTAPITIRVRG